MTKELSREESHKLALTGILDLIAELDKKKANNLTSYHVILGVVLDAIFTFAPSRSEIAFIIASAFSKTGESAQMSEKECPKCKEEK